MRVYEFIKALIEKGFKFTSEMNTTERSQEIIETVFPAVDH